MLVTMPFVAQRDGWPASTGSRSVPWPSRARNPFRLLHRGDTMVVLDPATLPDRLLWAGFDSWSVDHRPRRKISARPLSNH
ncbi:hypothetical protein GCM10022220_65930 [Actinocatenispora rupis]|uniref:Uncharacterized protein n=1 Tax=Actinocatenispora rupis TaxID=519421 RepID=A0A8J3JCQ1_9ACTN|nr:hypothetical protein Aru02nite_69260 [Actinocatenispora rupis]